MAIVHYGEHNCVEVYSKTGKFASNLPITDWYNLQKCH